MLAADVSNWLRPGAATSPARLIEAGHCHEGDLPVLVVFDAGYDVTRLAWLLADLPLPVSKPGMVTFSSGGPSSGAQRCGTTAHTDEWAILGQMQLPALRHASGGQHRSGQGGQTIWMQTG